VCSDHFKAGAYKEPSWMRPLLSKSPQTVMRLKLDAVPTELSHLTQEGTHGESLQLGHSNEHGKYKCIHILIFDNSWQTFILLQNILHLQFKKQRPAQLNDFDSKFKIQSVDAAGFDKYHKCEITKTRVIDRVFLRNLLYIMYYILFIKHINLDKQVNKNVSILLSLHQFEEHKHKHNINIFL